MGHKSIRVASDVRGLALDAVAALEEANLLQEVRELHTRVLTLDPEALFEVRRMSDEDSEWAFKPIVELLLREIRAIASAADVSLQKRREEIGWVPHISGF